MLAPACDLSKFFNKFVANAAESLQMFYYLVISLAHATRMGARFSLEGAHLETLNGIKTPFRILQWARKGREGEATAKWSRAGIMEVEPAVLDGLIIEWPECEVAIVYPHKAGLAQERFCSKDLGLRACYDSATNMRAGESLVMVMKSARRTISDPGVLRKLQSEMDQHDMNAFLPV